MPSHPSFLSIFTTTLLLSLIIYLPIETPLKMNAAIAQPASSADRKTEADRLLQQGIQQSNHSQYQEAIHSWQQALNIYQEIGDRNGEASSLANLGATYNSLKQDAKAVDVLQQALAIFQSIENWSSEIAVLGSIGQIYLAQKQYDQARSALQQQLEIAKQINDRTNEQLATTGIGNTYLLYAQQLHLNSAYAEAIEAAKQAVEPFQQALALVEGTNLGQDLAEVAVINLVSAYSTQGFAFGDQQEYPEAITAFQQGLSTLKENSDRLSKGTLLDWQYQLLLALGNAYSNNGQYSEALIAEQEALQVAEQLNQPNYQIYMHTLFAIAAIQRRLGNLSEALATSQQALAIAQEKLPEDQEVKVTALITLAQAYEALGQYSDALKGYQQSLVIAKTDNDINYEISILANVSGIYQKQEQYLQALEYSQQSQSMLQNAIQQLQANMTQAYPQFCGFLVEQDTLSEQQCLQSFETRLATSSNTLGLIYSNLGRYTESLAVYQKALAIAQQYKVIEQQMTILNNLGQLYQLKGEYTKAHELLQKALQIARDTGSRPLQSVTLNNIGGIYEAQGQYLKALESYQQELILAKAIEDPRVEANALDNIGSLYHTLGNDTDALTTLQQSLQISQQIGTSASSALSNIATIFSSQGRYSEALENLQQALELITSSGDRLAQSDLLIKMSRVYENQANYVKSLELAQQALSIQQEIGARFNQIISLTQLGQIYYSLGDYKKALELHQQALQISREIGSRSGEMLAIGTVGRFYLFEEQYGKALEFYQQGLSIAREIGHVGFEGSFLDGIAWIYEKQGHSEQAIEAFQQSLKIHRGIGSRPSEGTNLNGLGVAYTSEGKITEALAAFQQAIEIAREAGQPAEEAAALANTGKALAKDNQPELAIVFYKRSVNIRESIRQGLRTLSDEQQQSYTATIADSYRQLADLLLRQNRVLEAQQVLDLLKVQELNDYLQTVRGDKPQQIVYWQPEQQILDLYEHAIAEGLELARLDAKQTLTPNEQQRYAELQKHQGEILTAFDQFIHYPEVQSALTQLRQAAPSQAIEPENFNQLQSSLRELHQGAVLFYPLILEDRLELVLVTPNTPPIRHVVPVKAADLNQAIVELGQALKDPGVDAKPAAQKLYEWLVKPIEVDLAAANAKTIIYAPDGALRYIPLAALYDGNQWLAQRFAINFITAASLVNLSNQPSYQQAGQNNLSILAAACARCQFTISLPSGTSFNFSDLPSARTEVENLAAEVPGTTVLIDQAFDSSDNTLSRIRRSPIVHLATHAAVVPGQTDQSFIVFGDGKSVSLQQVRQTWNLPNTDLVVLSACQTAVGERQLGSGIEILGLGYQMQQAGARAAIASLWSVSDGGTQALMDAFYAALRNGATKAEALQQAQIALITGNYDALENQQRGIVGIRQRIQQGVRADVVSHLSHPYYWAPFILIGNGL